MTILQPGEYWDGLEIKSNPKFASRAASKRDSLEEVFFSKVLYAAEMCQRQGWDINPETLQMVNPDLPTTKLAEVLQTDKLQNALAARGIPMSTKSGLSPRQLAAISVFFDMSTPATLTQKLRIAGVSKMEWDGWFRQPAFAARMSELAEDATALNTPTAQQRLAQAVDNGAPWAIQFALAMNKRYDPKAETVDPMIAVRQILDVLDEILPAEMLAEVDEAMKAKREGRPFGRQVLRIDPPESPAATLSPTEPEG